MIAFAVTFLAAAFVGGDRIVREVREQLPWLEKPRALDAVSIGALVALTVSAYRAMALGIPPSTQDHNFHMLKAIQTENLLRHGHLTGWSDLELAGHPHNVLYPFAHTLVVAAIDVFVDFERAYAWTLLLVALLCVLGVWFIARLHFTRGTAFLAGIFALFDPGGWGVGGWSFTFETGVWPSSVAAMLAMIAIALVPRTVERNTMRAALGPGVCLGLAILFHPSAVLVTTFVSPFLLFAFWIAKDDFDLRRLLVTAGRVALIGLAVASFWFVPFSTQGRHMFHAPHVAWPSKEMWNAVIDGWVFRQPALYAGVTVCGLLLLARRREVFPRLMIVFIPVALAFMNIESLRIFHLLGDGPYPLASRLQPERVLYVGRVFAMIAAAYAFVTLGLPAAELFALPGRRAVAMRLALGGAMTLALCLPGARIPGGVSTPVGVKKEDRPHLEKALDKAVAMLGKDGRLVLLAETSDHTLVGPAAQRNVPIEKIGTSASMFVTQFHALDINRMWDRDMVRRTGARAVLSKGDLAPWMGHLQTAGTFGPYKVYAIDPLPRAWLRGSTGSVDVVSWADERIELDVKNTNGEGKVQLFLGYYDAWHLEGGGEVESWTWQDQRLTEVTPRDGRMVLVYRRKGIEHVGLALSIVLAAVVVGLLRRERKLAAMPASPPLPHRDPDPVAERDLGKAAGGDVEGKDEERGDAPEDADVATGGKRDDLSAPRAGDDRVANADEPKRRSDPGA